MLRRHVVICCGTILIVHCIISCGAFRAQTTTKPFLQSSFVSTSSSFVRNIRKAQNIPSNRLITTTTVLPSTGVLRRRTIIVKMSENTDQEDTAMTTTTKPQFEIEQKFQLLSSKNNDGGDGVRNNNNNNNNVIEERLKQLNFQSKGTIRFVDWYFDSRDIILSTQDYWLRFREKENERDNGIWQLKKGSGGQQSNDTSSSTTVYIELEGSKAISTALDALSEHQPTTTTTTKGSTSQPFQPPVVVDPSIDEIPELPDPKAKELLAPFCRIVTTRSSWAFKDPSTDMDTIPNQNDTDNAMDSYVGLMVDLDCTDTGFAVGEVEALVETEADIPQAKRRIQILIDKLKTTDDSEELNKNNNKNNICLDDSPAIGKLEHFLMTHRPEHYKACIESGSMKTTGQTKN